MNKLMNKILSKNVAECIEEDLYWYGLDYIRKVYRNMCYSSTLNKEYKIRLDRRDCQLWVEDNLPKYICSMTFLNNLGYEVLKLEFSEYMAIQLIDSLYTYEEFNMIDVEIPIESINSIGVGYVLRLVRDSTDNTKIKVYVIQYNLMNTSDFIVRLVFYLDSTNLFTDLMYAMYFSWLIDIDNGKDISLMEQIYSRIVEQV